MSLCIALFSACVFVNPLANAVPVDQKQVLKEAESGANWLVHGRTFDEQRHNPLKQINRKTVGKLGLDWFTDVASLDGTSATPLVIDGVIYFSGNFSQVWAYDARTGKQIWHYAQV